MEKLLTVLIQTSPLPSHPSTALLEALFRSFDRVDGLKEAHIIILADGCECEEETSSTENFKHGTVSPETRANYKQHLQLLQEKIVNRQAPFQPLKNGTIQLVKLPYRHGSARAIAAAFNMQPSIISTPYILIGQHDNFFVRDVAYLASLLRYMEDESWLQCVHFPSTATLNYVTKVKRRYQLDISKCCVGYNGGSFIPLVFWYGRTHISRTTYYTDFILRQCPDLQVCDHLEELFGTVQLNELNKIKKSSEDEFEDEFRRVHKRYSNYVYFDNDTPEEQMEVLYHMSGRKVRAATNSTPSEQEMPRPNNTDDAQKSNTRFNPHPNSFTSARRSIASVPGLEFVPSASGSSSKPPKKFKQNCFHCGKKGHSFKFCPSIQDETDMPSIDVLQI
mmetsp:Transcript_19256/g.38704  ORF Transcript_19256/g.38704 Transcript_19256/m.38704 type:complete len:392 (-) Transcript_19256:2333-3508(-)